MEDMTARLVKLRDDAEDCALISRLANDRKKRELFARLADHLSGLADEVEHAIAEASVADLHSGDNRGCRLGGPGRPGPARGLNPAAGLFPRKRPGAGAGVRRDCVHETSPSACAATCTGRSFRGHFCLEPRYRPPGLLAPSPRNRRSAKLFRL